MKKFIEIFKNMRNIIKILQFISEALTAIAEVYNKYFPNAEGKGKVEEPKDVKEDK